MRMIPDTPHRTHSQAEKRVFDRLRVSFASDKVEAYTAYHSLNLTRHAYKRFGEMDFLICCPEGLYALEIKGGRVVLRDGVWQYTNRYGVVNESVEGPFKQAESALHGLMHKLRDNLPAWVLDQFSIGYGVVFPDIDWTVSGSEWDPRTLADARSSKDLERWLRRLFRYWRGKGRGNHHARTEALKKMRKFLRPEFEAVIPLHVQTRGVEERIATLTEDQMNLVDVVAANRRVLCSGGAGTGKTFLAMELARRWTAEGMNVALVCRSPWLKSYLGLRFPIANLTVSLVDTIRTASSRRGLEHFDAFIVDEGQDLFDMNSLDSLDSILQGGLSEGRWCFFYDINNQSGFFGRPDRDAVDYLASLQPTSVPLRTNCRNTRIILEKVQTSLGADMGIKGAGDGPKVREHRAFSINEASNLLEVELVELIDVGGLSASSVTILSPYRFDESCVGQLPEAIRRQITILDEFSLKHFPSAKTSFAEIGNFKGLENEAIIVVDLPSPERSREDLAAHYVAMSRARAVLSLIQQCAT